jgi:O-succinylbenzoic acid--CoA ligase
MLETMAPDRLVDEAGSHRLQGRTTEGGDALVVATSGTTGEPRGVVLTHDAVLASARATATRLAVNENDVWLACLPLSHVGGLAVVTRAVLTDTPLVVHDGFNATDVTASAAGGATLVSLVPTALRRIEPSAFRRILLGGSPPPVELPDNVVTTYGMTETGSGVVYDGVPLDDVEVRIDASGEILLRGPTLLRCYRDESSPLVGGWLSTGDLGAFGADGRLHVHGRRSELIITGGENVWPTTVETVLATHPGVADVAVTGENDPEWGQRVVAWIVPTMPDVPPSLDSLRATLEASLPKFMAPKQVRYLPAIPRTASGKVQRQALAQ